MCKSNIEQIIEITKILKFSDSLESTLKLLKENFINESTFCTFSYTKEASIIKITKSNVKLTLQIEYVELPEEVNPILFETYLSNLEENILGYIQYSIYSNRHILSKDNLFDVDLSYLLLTDLSDTGHRNIPESVNLIIDEIYNFLYRV